MPFYAPDRVTAENALVFVRPIATTGLGAGTLVPISISSLAVPVNAFGPARNVVAQDPRVKVQRTAIGDSGDHNLGGRRGTWRVRIEALMDKNPLVSDTAHLGDARWPGLINQVVDFAIAIDGFLPLWLCRGTGHFEGEVEFNTDENVNVIRNVEITRAFGSGKYGDLVWADPYTGLFPADVTLPVLMKPLPDLPTS